MLAGMLCIRDIPRTFVVARAFGTRVTGPATSGLSSRFNRRRDGVRLETHPRTNIDEGVPGSQCLQSNEIFSGSRLLLAKVPKECLVGLGERNRVRDGWP